jgi:hypothetical protein
LFSSKIKEIYDVRFKLEEKRLIEAWFYYRYLHVSVEIENRDKILAFHVNDLDKNIQDLNTKLFKFFVNKWNGPIHRFLCQNKNCCKTFTIDGNQKVTRLKCLWNKTDFCSNEFGKLISFQ